MIRFVRPPYWLLLGASFLAGTTLGCEQGAEGDRCNPDLVDTTECNSGLSCVTPPSCVISVCCPSKGPYTDPNCDCFANPQGPMCLSSCNVDAAWDGMPTPDGGTADAHARDATTMQASMDAGKDGSHE
jgi:hypothetical protein